LENRHSNIDGGGYDITVCITVEGVVQANGQCNQKEQYSYLSEEFFA